MAKVFGIRPIELLPGVKEAEFERFMVEEGLQFPALPGETSYLVRGDRGEGVGKYLLITEFERVEDRDRLYPSPTETVGQSLQREQTYAALLEKFATLVSAPVFTDYVEIGRFRSG
jgi:hypothetical protein